MTRAPELSHPDFRLATQTAYLPSGLLPASVQPELESGEYGALTCTLGGKRIVYRVGKTTPTKPGLFVTVWKRENSVTKPHHVADNFDFLILSARDSQGFGQFIFPKAIAQQHGVISSPTQEGKRGIRIYPPWVETLSKQAQKTQRWQCEHFLRFETTTPSAVPGLLELFTA